MKCLKDLIKLKCYHTISTDQSTTRYYKCPACGYTCVTEETIKNVNKEVFMDSKVAAMISWCQAIANAYDAYSKGKMSKEVYLAIFKEKLQDKPDMSDMPEAFPDSVVKTEMSFKMED